MWAKQIRSLGIGKGNTNSSWRYKWTRNLTHSDYHTTRPYSIASEMQVNNNYKPPAALHITTNDPEAHNLTLNSLKSGNIVAVPTDTIYGIACCVTNHKAINKLYTVKARNESKPVAICLSEIVEIRNWAVIDHLPTRLLEVLFPGPVTLILKAAKALDKLLVFNDKVGIRIPNHDFVRTVVKSLGCPIALTSANISNEPSAVQIGEFKSLWNKLSCVVDGGCLSSNRSGSTVVDLSEPGFYKIIRSGMAHENTCKLLRKYRLVERC